MIENDPNTPRSKTIKIENLANLLGIDLELIFFRWWRELII